jgi:hypothetical protein
MGCAVSTLPDVRTAAQDERPPAAGGTAPIAAENDGASAGSRAKQVYYTGAARVDEPPATAWENRP